MEIVAVSLPPVFEAVISNVAVVVIDEGVPDITPVDKSSERPAGSDGDTDQVVTVPPVIVGAEGAIGVPLVKVYGLSL